MVASISARKSVGAAVAYYKHMAQDEYYTGDREADGEWSGRGAERLALEGAVTKAEFEAALNGRDPRTGERLNQIGRTHAPGWDMTFSAPKSVSVMWALSPPAERARIEQAHRKAVTAATRHLEDNHAVTRRGRGGAIREPVAGLVIARFHHHTSRDLDPQLHTHAFIFNSAPRRDGSWGSIVSRDLYKAQKEVGAVYREHLGRALERDGHAVRWQGTGFRLGAIPYSVERAFSKRRLAIEQAAETHGYRTPKGMELAALRTRQAKRPRERAALFEAWKHEARTLGFDLKQARERAEATPGLKSPAANTHAAEASTPTVSHQAMRLLQKISGAARSADSTSSLNVSLRQKQVQRDREAER
ncbi:putative ATP-dependent exoDNAse (exonuclease V) subunit alpha [Hyphomonas polymorpha PS728]|uniref:Putative ATP-dependent exoDNAse (Exonuclease V) subunit alpha n=1 Tax=Hyphomonas polymorpha PS728 TaxID=1280954 RepID=A0A062VDT2_9PROT|nr:MobF family relaxase [Hyphomonas polymorpha]KCZ97595.1 putative ATP-dependent exoDNAse (exonuclease V) subunit alpha [Hyphomonas polymorpha PS728]